jgi:6,7-dimethyl-8-ribityllumazine synthase
VVRANPAWSEYLFVNRRTKFVAAIELQIRQLNQSTFREMAWLLDKYPRGGEIMRVPLDIAVSILVGPAQQFARMWLGHRTKIDIAAAMAPLADAAWRSIRSSPEDEMMDKIAIVDTTFARFDMGGVAEAELRRQSGFGEKFELVRATVPGVKDLGVACKRLIEREKCSIVLAFGMPGRAELDRLSAHEASLGLMAAQLLTTTPIL